VHFSQRLVAYSSPHFGHGRGRRLGMTVHAVTPQLCPHLLELSNALCGGVIMGGEVSSGWVSDCYCF
jgi:hypothetical protein